MNLTQEKVPHPITTLSFCPVKEKQHCSFVGNIVYCMRTYNIIQILGKLDGVLIQAYDKLNNS